MLNFHIKIAASASDLKSLKDALLLIAEKMDENNICNFHHDDFQFDYETFDNETLQIFGINPKNFIHFDLPSNL